MGCIHQRSHLTTASPIASTRITGSEKRAKPYHLALIKTSLDDVIGTQQSARGCHFSIPVFDIHFSFIYVLFAESSIDTFKEMCILHNISIKIDFACLL